jgi:hypothetical protein
MPLVHGYFAPSIILSARFSHNFKQDFACFACLFLLKNHQSSIEARHSHRTAAEKIR